MYKLICRRLLVSQDAYQFFFGLTSKAKPKPFSSPSFRYPSLRTYNVRPAFIDDTGAKPTEGSKPFSYALMDEMAPVLRLARTSAVKEVKKALEE